MDEHYITWFKQSAIEIDSRYRVYRLEIDYTDEVPVSMSEYAQELYKRGVI